MSLFSKLLRLSSGGTMRLEDFHTEIVAYVLRSFSELTIQWLSDLGLTDAAKPDKVAVETQEQIDALESHDGLGSRPDISIRINRDHCTELIFVESKIGSREGSSQLQRYADHLAATKDLSKRSLIYITRDF